MSKARIHILWQRRAACMLIVALLLSGTVQAQLSLKRQKYDDIAARYKSEHAVYTDISHKIEIKEDGGGLAATTRVVREKLFISDKSLNTLNEEELSGGTNFSYLNNSEAIAYIPEGNDYRAVKNRDKNGYVNTDYTGLTKKTLTRTTYSISHEEMRWLPKIFLSNDLITLNSVLEVTAPKYVKMGFLLKGADTSTVKRSIEEKNGLVTYRFTATNVPADKEYEGVPSALYYRLHVIPYIVSYRLTGAKKDSVLAGNLDAHRKFEYTYVKGLNLTIDSILTKKTAELTKYAYSERDKARRIYDWVQNNFHYLALYPEKMDGHVPHPADTVCKRMYGDCKDMSSIIMAMCQKAGVSAYFAVIGTDNNPYTHEELQSDYLYDHMICATKIDGEWVFLDGTTHVQPFGANRPDLQGKEAYIMIDDQHHVVVKIPEAPATKNTMTDNTTMNITYNDVSGTTNQHYTGYPAWDLGELLAHKNRTEDKDDFARALANRGSNKFLVKNYTINASQSGDKDVTLSTNYTLGNYVQHVKKDYYVNMNVKNTNADKRINEANRNVPYYFRFKHKISETVTLNVPKGYRVSYLPKPAKGGVNGLWSYSISYKADKKANTITLTKEYDVNTMQVAPSQFEAHNKLVDELKKQYKETVVLTAK